MYIKCYWYLLLIIKPKRNNELKKNSLVSLKYFKINFGIVLNS